MIPSLFSAGYAVVCPVTGKSRAPAALAEPRANVAHRILNRDRSLLEFIFVFLFKGC